MQGFYSYVVFLYCCAVFCAYCYINWHVTQYYTLHNFEPKNSKNLCRAEGNCGAGWWFPLWSSLYVVIWSIKIKILIRAALRRKCTILTPLLSIVMSMLFIMCYSISVMYFHSLKAGVQTHKFDLVQHLLPALETLWHASNRLLHANSCVAFTAYFMLKIPK